MSQNSSNSSDLSDPSDSSDQENSYYSDDSAKNESDKQQSKSNTVDKSQGAISKSSNYTSDADSSTVPSKDNEEKNQNTKSSEDSDSAKSDSESESKNESSEQSEDKKEESKASSESKNSSDSEEKPTVNKNINIESASDQPPSSKSDNSSDDESKPVVKNVKAKPEKPAEHKSELKSIYKDSNSDSENKSASNSDSKEEPQNKKSSDKKLSKERSASSMSAKEKSKKGKEEDSKKNSTKKDKSTTSKKSKKSVAEEKGNSRQSKRRSKISDDTKDEENTSKKSKKSQTSKKSRHQTRNKDNDDDDYEYDNDSDNETRKSRNTSKSKKDTNPSQLSAEELDEAFEREDAVIEAVYQFNSRKNVSKLCAYFNAEETPEGVAHVIRTTKGLNGEIIGDYLGKKENSKILSAYFMEVDMKCGYIEAMRRSLSGPMFLPGEGQIIDRILQEFANCYVQQNPGKYSNADELYVLSFALVMLNSDLHNRNVQNRMTVKEFIRNTRHLLSADDVTDKELTEMYNEIQSTPFSFTNHTNDFWWEVAPKIRGYLQKKSEHSFSKWTKKYFVLTNSCLYYFKDDNPANEGKPLGVIQLTEVEVNVDRNDPLMIKITATNDEISYVKFKKIPKPVKGIKKISLKAPDRASASRWHHRIKKSAIMSNFLSDKLNENNNMNQKM